MNANLERIETLGALCPICGKPDWCLRSQTTAVCARVQLCELPSCTWCRSGHPRRYGDGGYLHRLAPEQRGQRRFRATHVRIPDVDGFASLHQQCLQDIQSGQVHWLAQHLGVSEDSLRRLQVGWLEPQGFTFPVHSPERTSIVGLSVRPICGSKRAVPGSACGSGLYIPTDLDASRAVFCPEGASDVAALLTLDLQAIGRVSVGTSVNMVRRAVVHHQFAYVVTVADVDSSGIGQAAAAQLSLYLRHFTNSYLLIPPCKDIRSWLLQGATRSDVIRRVKSVE